MNIRFQCGQCGQTMEVDESGAGLQVQCPACRNIVLVPQAQRPSASPTVAPQARNPTSAGASSRAVSKPLERMGTRYKALRTVAIILKVVAALYLVVFTVLGLVAIAGGLATGAEGARQGAAPEFVTIGAAGGVITGISLIVGGALIAVFIYALAELILLMIDIEENTRATKELLKGSG